MRVHRLLSQLVAILAALATPAAAADLQPATVAAFNRYTRITEQRLDRGAYLWVDALDAVPRRAALTALHRGELVIESLTTKDAGRPIDVPDGLIHHWIGTVFIPGRTVDAAVALLQDYDRHAEIYGPVVARSRLLARRGSTFQVSLRFAMTQVITVVTDTEHEAHFTRDAPDRAQSRIRSTRIAEIEDADSPGEHEQPVGHDGGYLWRLNSYWRFQQRDGGVYVQCESITLTRGIPAGFGWLVRPFVASIPRESLTFTLTRTRDALLAAAP